VASRLGLSRATVHQYVTALYRHSRVQSRAQLLVHVLKLPPGQTTLDDSSGRHQQGRRCTSLESARTRRQLVQFAGEPTLGHCGSSASR
jgi:hypothetical protein